MGSIKKKLTKGLRKITPKEIAPALSIASMLIPGMGIMNSSMAKFLVQERKLLVRLQEVLWVVVWLKKQL